MPLNTILIYLMLIAPASSESSWGFFAHEKINFYAVFTLPEEMIGFYKYHIDYITTEAVKADKRRYAVKDEAPKHYIDIELYPDPIDSIPMYYKDAEERYSSDSIKSWGSVPWSILQTKYNLTEAMRKKEEDAILRYATDLGHYIADAHVPLHTTVNYNGQLTGQQGIHGLWESRLPELFFKEYDLFTGKAEYVGKPADRIRKIITDSHNALDSVLRIEKQVTNRIRESQKYTFVARGNVTLKNYSKYFSEKYHNELNGMVERRLRESIKSVGDFWYTCWIDAGQPDLIPAKKREAKSPNVKFEPERVHEN